MNKSTKIILTIVSIILVIVVVLAVVTLTKPKDEKQIETINSAEELEGLINKV